MSREAWVRPRSVVVIGVIGMGAVFAGAARAPMTAVLLIIEMTGQHALLLPLMLATVLATFISRFLSRGTLFTEELRRRGEDVEDPMTTTLLGRTHASRLMVDPPAVLEDTAQLNEAASLMSDVASRPCPWSQPERTAPVSCSAA